jgi:excisionase family DNA binding protein
MKLTERLTLGQACRLLGVSQTTLRYWTDEGRVKAFITPGGHRRYEKADLTAFMQGQRQAQGIKDLVARIEESTLQQGTARKYFLSRPWYESLAEEHRVKFRERGRRLVELILLHIAHPSRQETSLEQARALGEEYGHHLAELGLPLSEALEAFTLHRGAVLDVAMGMLGDRQPVNKRALNAFPRITWLVDQVLLSLVEVYLAIPQISRGNLEAA